jgi:SET domain-containing protein
MMLVKTRLLPSPIEGYGLFADQDIPKGTPTWKFVPGLDQLLSPEDFEKLPELMRNYVMRYAYQNKKTKMYVVCADDARFMNHSTEANTMGIYPPGEVEGVDIATRDIKKGEELLCNYLEFDAEFELKMSLAEPKT